MPTPPTLGQKPTPYQQAVSNWARVNCRSTINVSLTGNNLFNYYLDCLGEALEDGYSYSYTAFITSEIQLGNLVKA